MDSPVPQSSEQKTASLPASDSGILVVAAPPETWQEHAKTFYNRMVDDFNVMTKTFFPFAHIPEVSHMPDSLYRKIGGIPTDEWGNVIPETIVPPSSQNGIAQSTKPEHLTYKPFGIQQQNQSVSAPPSYTMPPRPNIVPWSIQSRPTTSTSEPQSISETSSANQTVTPVGFTPQLPNRIPNYHSYRPSIPTVAAVNPSPPNQKYNFRYQPTNIPESPFSGKTRIVSLIEEDTVPHKLSIPVILFSLASYIYGSVTAIIFVAILVLTDMSYKIRTPDFLFLKYYINIAYVPVILCTCAIYLHFVAQKLKNGSRISWIIACISGIIIPIGTVMVLPPLTDTIHKLFSLYPSPNHIMSPIVSAISILNAVSFFPIFLIGLIAPLIVFVKSYTHQAKELPLYTRQSIILELSLFLVPMTTFLMYGSYMAVTNDNGKAFAQAAVSYPIYEPVNQLTERIVVSRYVVEGFQDNVDLSVTARYDLPLPMLIRNQSSPIDISQSVLPENIDLETYVWNSKSEADSDPEAAFYPGDPYPAGYFVSRGQNLSLYKEMPERVVIRLSSEIVDRQGLLDFGESLH